MKIRTHLISDCGQHRHRNEDAALTIRRESPFGPVVLAVVCDGVGGLSHGDMAASITVWTFRACFQCCDIKQIGTNFLRETMSRADRAVRTFAEKRGVRMATTCTAILICGKKVHILHIGDGGVYRKGWRWRRMTPVHQVVHADGTYLSRAIGCVPLRQAFTLSRRVYRGSRWLLCSDGFMNRTDWRADPLDGDLVSMIPVLRARGETDNVTACLIEVE